ncbi:6-phosphofructokinase [Lactococcus sp.]|uniref:6-phosphofructokinase n=1 Tax=Lactococcus sp. TaxID=44273 RepID=UPI0035AE24D0
MKRIGILTSGGDCAGLNPAIYALAKSLYGKIDNLQLVGILDGYTGLIEGRVRELVEADFEGLIEEGGTFLGSIRQSFKTIDIKDENGSSKADKMVKNVALLQLDALVVLGGNGTHKVANLLAERGVNIVALPKTIDNDIFGTDETFGYNTATQVGVDYIERIRTTAASHSRVFIIEIMGNKVGWLALSTGLASGADMIILPEFPYSVDKMTADLQAILKKKNYALVVVSEGAFSKDEKKLKNKERLQVRQELGFRTISEKLAHEIESELGIQVRTAMPGHALRGGTANAYDRNYTLQLGAYAADLVADDVFGVTVAKVKGKITHNQLKAIAGKAKPVTDVNQKVLAARSIGISFGD